MLNVFLTVDTEIWPFADNWPRQPLPEEKQDFTAEFAAYILGRTNEGDFGLPFQIRVLNENGLEANYFTEALAADRLGHVMLSDVVSMIQPARHDVQLHIHTEWLGDVNQPSLPGRFMQHVRHFSEDEQTSIIARGIENLVAAGAPRPNAMRAGNYGASLATLRAARRCSLSFDTSHNTCYLDSSCDMPLDSPALQPLQIEGIWEFPVSYFQDYPGHYRHAQLCACSFQELAQALTDASRAGWYAFVIVLHSFELVKIDKARSGSLVPDKFNVRRFLQLCQFLSENRKKFRTRLFSELSEETIPVANVTRHLSSRPQHTALRFAQQALSRIS